MDRRFLDLDNQTPSYGGPFSWLHLVQNPLEIKIILFCDFNYSETYQCKSSCLVQSG